MNSGEIKTNKEWITAFQKGALEDAAYVRFLKTTNREENAVSYQLQSFTKNWEVIGDPREYELLKQIIPNFEKLSANHDNLMVECDLTTMTIVLEN